MRYPSFHPLPDNPLARVLAVVGLVATLVLAFFLGIVVLAVVAGLALLGTLYLAALRLMARLRPGSRTASRNDPLDVEYRVIRRQRDGH